MESPLDIRPQRSFSLAASSKSNRNADPIRLKKSLSVDDSFIRYPQTGLGLHTQPSENSNTTESTEQSGNNQSRSSETSTPPNTSDNGLPTVENGCLEPPTQPEAVLITPSGLAKRYIPPSRAMKRSREPRDGDSDSAAIETPDVAVTVTHGQDTHQDNLDITPAPNTATISEKVTLSLAEKQQKRGRIKIKIQKYIVGSALISINALLIFASWWWRQYYYIYLPFICLPLALNCAMIFSIICFKLRNTIRPEPLVEPRHPETLVMLLPCYNETLDECTRSLDSLVNQRGIEENKLAIIIVCDGRVRGPGMQKTTAEYLMDDILVDCAYRGEIKRAYRAWDGQHMDIEFSRGHFKGVPFYCVAKKQNMGKRDSLIVVRSFLYKYNLRSSRPTTIFAPEFFVSMCDWLVRAVETDQVDHLIGMDADTVFDETCIASLLAESKHPNTVGVCGYVSVDFAQGHWNLWSLYQNAEYTIAQGLRRLHQSIATKKVSCLPGCCQLLRICEYTCGDTVLVELFGYHPTPRDGIIKQIRATASEDRNHVCLMLTTYPQAQTRQALRARAYTDVPHSWCVFLSQRRRWTLGATSNDLLLVTSRHCQWWERILAFSNVLVWFLNFFVIACIGCMIVAFATQPWYIIMAFAGVMLIPLVYYVVMAMWLPRTARERAQFLLGLCGFVVFGPFINTFILVFTLINMDNFGWGKTRQVVPDDAEAEGGVAESDSNGRTAGDAGRRYDEEAAVLR